MICEVDGHSSAQPVLRFSTHAHWQGKAARRWRFVSARSLARQRAGAQAALRFSTLTGKAKVACISFSFKGED